MKTNTSNTELRSLVPLGETATIGRVKAEPSTSGEAGKALRQLVLPFYLFCVLNLEAQMNDNIWFFEQTINNTFLVDFKEQPPSINMYDIHMRPIFTNSSFCEGNGNLFCYTDGKKINNRETQLMENGDSLNVGYWANESAGYSIFNGAFFLPSPADSTKTYLIYMSLGHEPGAHYFMDKAQYALIDNTANNGLGKVVEKRKHLLLGSPQYNFLHAGAVRHANGRDWWIIVPNRMQPKYYRMLLTPEGFSQPDSQEIGFKLPTTDPNYYIGPNLFSPDGTKYADYDLRTGVQFFDFDRCTGMLSNPVKIDYTLSTIVSNGVSGVAFSPSSRFAYLTYAVGPELQLKQYDIQAPDIAASEQLIFSCTNYPWTCGLGQLLLGPNGKIYITDAIDSTAFHYIDKPNLTGTACGFKYGGFDFGLFYPANTMPYFPNYRLGPIDGSSCDTLGINNVPVASFFWDVEEQTACPCVVDFSNVSYHEPDTYFWDFGDGGTSTEVNPLHDYSAIGSYNVCLTASNVYGSDTVCKLVEVDTLPIIPVAAFSWDAVELEVTFTNNSINAPTDFLWDFGDPTGGTGNTSTEASPQHSYPSPGSYNACLTASNANGSNTACQLVIVDTLPAPPVLPVAAFTWDTVELVASFTNTSYNAPTTFLWDFGDPASGAANNSMETDPVHSYPAPGDYQACLVATNTNGSDTTCQWVTVDTLLDSVSLVVRHALPTQALVKPNPTAGKVWVEMSRPLGAITVWKLFDPLGREVRRAMIPAGQQRTEVGLADLPPGMYYWGLVDGGRQFGSGKLVVLH